MEAKRLAEIERWGQCEEVGHHGKRCRYAKGHDRGHHAGDGVTWLTDIDHEGGQAHELRRLFETCKTIVPGIELPAWIEVQADLAHLAYLWGIDEKPEVDTDA